MLKIAAKETKGLQQRAKGFSNPFSLLNSESKIAMGEV
jgi:hypothetical protein